MNRLFVRQLFFHAILFIIVNYFCYICVCKQLTTLFLYAPDSHTILIINLDLLDNYAYALGLSHRKKSAT